MRAIAFAVAVAVCSLAPTVVHAQADVGDPNSVSIGLAYVFGRSTKIIETDGFEIVNARTIHHIITLSGDYVTPVEGLAIEAQLPIVGTKWDDTSLPHFPTAGEWDDGSYHFTPTDVRAGLRYQFLREPFSAAVAVAGSVPVKDYPTYGYTAPDRHLKAVHLGLAVSKVFDPIYVAASYEFSLVEKYTEVAETEDYGQNRSDFSAVLGWFIGDKLDLHAAFDGRIQHGGIDYADFTMLSDAVQMHHDAVLRENQYLVGGGVGYQLTDALALAADFRIFVAGANTRNANLFGVSAEYQIH
jgi:hypothetical protein